MTLKLLVLSDPGHPKKDRRPCSRSRLHSCTAFSLVQHTQDKFIDCVLFFKTSFSLTYFTSGDGCTTPNVLHTLENAP